MLVAAISCVISLGICFYGFKIKQLIFALIIGYTCYKIGNYFLLPIIEDSNLLLTLCAGIGLFFAMFYKKLYEQ